MASLTAHLRRPSDHGRLAFHPECPVCCGERLAGALPADALIGHRTQALLAAGVLAVSTAAPTAVLAAEPDQQQEDAAAPDQVAAEPNQQAGATAPDQVAADTPPSDPGVDPGGDSTDLPFDAGPAPEVQASPDPAGDMGPLEQEPVANEDAPTADPGDGTGTQGTRGQQAPPAKDAAPPAAAPTAPRPPSEPPSAPAPETPATTAPQPPPEPTSAVIPETRAEPDTDTAAAPRERETARKRAPRPRATAPQTVRVAPAPQPEAVVTAPATIQVTQPAVSSSDAASRSRAAQRGDRFHVVGRGESLWSIADDLLGGGASAARIAREVNRLWELNSARIATGDPDLLLAGTRLALR